MSHQAIRVLLVDDHASIRAGLRLLLDSAADIEVVGEATDGTSAVRQTTLLEPDVVVMDARMPGTDGITATRQIVATTAAEVLVLTTFDLDEVVLGALRAGAAGFLLKSAEPTALLDGIRRVAAGDGIVAPEVTRTVLAAFAAGRTGGVEPDPPSPSDPTGARVQSLTPRELDVLAALGRGLSNAAIGDELHISLATVKSHVSSVLSKLQLSSRMQAAIYARETDLA